MAEGSGYYVCNNLLPLPLGRYLGKSFVQAPTFVAVVQLELS